MKKILSISMASLLAFSMFAGTVFADEPAVQEDIDVVEDAALEDDTLEEDADEEMDLEGISSGMELAPEAEVELSEEGEIVLEDYIPIEITEDLVVVSDEEIDSMLDSIVNYYTTTDVITEGVAEDGDSVNIDFSGIAEGEEEPFEGGTAQGYDLVLGSGMFIPGFEDQVIGHSIGETFDVNVTFPEEYAENLAGKNAVFTVTLNSKSKTVVPELTDELVKQFAAENLDKEINSLDEMKEYTRGLLYENKLKNAIMSVIDAKTTVVSYKESYFTLMKEYALQNLKLYEMYGYDENTAANMFGFETAEAYETNEAMYYVKVFMMLDKLAADKGITYTDEDVNAEVAKYMSSYGYDQEYTIDEFIEMSGQAWLLLFSKVQVEYNLVMDALKDDVVIVPAATVEAEEVDVDELEDVDIEEIVEE